MFAFGGGSSSVTAGRHDPDQERQPPAPAIPLTLPKFVAPTTPKTKWSQGNIPDIFASFTAIKKPADIRLEHLDTLNVSYRPDCTVEDLLPALEAQTYIPPDAWLSTEKPPEVSSESTEPTPKVLLSSGRAVPGIKEFQIRLKEVRFDKQHAFSALTRMPSEGTTPPKLVHLRRFWEGLDNMAYYWDTSLDQYIPPNKPVMQTTEDTSGGVTSGLSRPNSSGQRGQTDEPRKKAKTEEHGIRSPSIHPALDSFFSSGAVSLPQRFSSSSPANERPKSRPSYPNGTYKGNRIGTATDMPEAYRHETVKAFLEAVCWAFSVTFTPHRRQPILTIKGLRFPVRMTNGAWRAPRDRLKARGNWLEGPVIGLQCRPEVDFGVKVNADIAGRLDAVRELAGLLFLAQERARTGQPEKKPGEGKWWTTVPRWGGGPGGEVGEATGASDAPPDPDKNKDSKDSYARIVAKPGPSKAKKKPSPAELWKIIKPGNGNWDPKVDYEHIGKAVNSAWDDVYMVSSVCHHFRIVRLHIHDAYTEYLTHGTLPIASPEDESWSIPTITQTRWFDMFKEEDRVEGMVALWSVLGYLMRTQETPDVPMSTA